MADPFTPAFIAANCIWAMIQNRADAAATGSVTRLAAALRKQQTPANHDVLAATHTAFVRSIQLMADACENAAGDAGSLFAARALARVARDRDFTTFSADPRAIPKKELDASIRAIFEGAEIDARHNAAEAVIARLEQAMGEPMADGFRALFRDGSDRHRSWPQAFELFFAEQVKTNERVFRALMFDRLNEILALAEARAGEMAALHDAIGRFGGEMHGRFDSVDDRLGGLAGDVKEILARLSRPEQDAPIALLRSLAEAFGDAHPEADIAELESHLRGKIGDYHKLRERIAAVGHEDNHDAALLADANIAISRGDFGAADRFLAQAEDLLDERVDRLLVRKAERRGLRGEAVRLMGDYATAIAHFDAAAQMIPDGKSEERARHAWSAASAAFEWGQLMEPAALFDAIHRWRQLVEATDRSSPMWPDFQIGLGIALSLLGERQEGTEALVEAATAFREALRMYPREKLPAEWARTQSCLGNALGRLGRRQQDTTTLDEAIAAFHAALEVLTDAEFRIDWASAKNNLGIALNYLGVHHGRTDALVEAAAIFREVLEVYSREHMPMEWAMATNNLGSTLAILGRRQEQVETVREAAAAFLEVQKVYTKDRFPIDWAMSQSNLANTNQILAVYEIGTGALDRAIAAYESVFEIYTRDEMPVQWALTKRNAGLTWLMVAGRTRDCASARQAVAAFEAALEVYSKPEFEWYRINTERNLGEARDLRDEFCR